MFSLSLSNIGWILYSNTKETLQKILARQCSYCGKYMKDWKWVLIKLLKLPNFFFNIRLSMYWQNTFVKILWKTTLVGKHLQDFSSYFSTSFSKGRFPFSENSAWKNIIQFPFSIRSKKKISKKHWTLPQIILTLSILQI